jgi:hypothetical protein
VRTQTSDGTRGRDGDLPAVLQRGEHSYYAEVPACQQDEQSRLIERLIDLAFDALGADHLDVRVQATEC